MAFSRFLQLNVTVSETISETTLETEATFNGVTFSFDRAMPVGTFVSGEPFVVSDQAFAITAISPAASDIQSDGFIGNGAMKNASVVGASPLQGFDGYLSSYPAKTTYETPYDTAANIDPAINGDIAVAQGERASITKAVRSPTKTSNTNQWQTIEKYVTLTVLDTAPPRDAFRPCTAGTTKPIRTRADVDFTPRNIALPASWPSVASILASVPDDLGLFDAGERHRFYRIDNALGTTNDGYSAEIIDAYARYVYLVNSSNVTEQQRQDVIDRIITFANQVEGRIDAGEGINFGAGQGGGLWLWGMAAAALLKDDALHQKFRGAAAPDRVCKWVSSTDLGTPAPGKSGVAAQTYFDEHLGLPWVEPDEIGSHHEARYSELAARIASWELVSVLAFNQGPGAASNGFEMILNGGANNNTNQLAAALNFISRWMTWNLATTSQGGPTTDLRDAFEDLVATGDFAEWNGKPEQYPTGQPGYAFDGALFAAGAGQITFNEPVGMDYATETVTLRDFRYSLDGVQWVTNTGVSLPHTETGLLRGVPHWCSARRWSASGAAPWSGNFPYAQPITSGAHRNWLVPTGTLSNTAPTYAGGTAPAVCTRLYPAWDYPLWKETTAALTVDEVSLAAGVGYPSAGYPAPTFSYQWQRSTNGDTGWSNISGASSAEYNRSATDAGQFLRCEVTATNSSGEVTVATNAVECPALTVLPAGTLIDTDFKGAFAVDYEAELGAATASGYVIQHRPTYALTGITSSLGALYFEKNGAHPKADLPLQGPALPSTVYAVMAQIVLNGDAFSQRGDFFLEIVESDGAVLFSQSYGGSMLVAENGYDALWTISGSFSSTNVADLSARIRWANGTGGGSGGNVGLSQLKVIAT
jgi:hypothetical protein